MISAKTCFSFQHHFSRRQSTMQAATARMVRSYPLFTNLLLSASVHDWLPGSSVGNPLSLIQTAKTFGVTKVAFLRHGKTAPANDGVDFNRLLSDEGRQQAQDAGESYGDKLKPLYPKLLVSPSPRTIETAEIFLKATGETDSVSLVPNKSLYDGTMQPEGSKLFKKIGYAPLKDFLNADDAQDRATSRRLLGSYFYTVADAILDVMNDTSEHESSTLIFVGHAIYLPAAALGVASLANCSEASLDKILSTNTREVEGYLVDLELGQVDYVRRDEC
jgi:broad specificity phosphatase PhoE